MNFFDGFYLRVFYWTKIFSRLWLKLLSIIVLYFLFVVDGACEKLGGYSNLDRYFQPDFNLIDDADDTNAETVYKYTQTRIVQSPVYQGNNRLYMVVS